MWWFLTLCPAAGFKVASDTHALGLSRSYMNHCMSAGPYHCCGYRHADQYCRHLQALLKEVTDATGQIILFIDEIHLVLGEPALQFHTVEARSGDTILLQHGNTDQVGPL